MKSIYISIITCLIMINCSTPYQPKGALGGYSSQNLDKNTFRVEFRGNQHTKVRTVFDYLERRCAEIAVDNGFDYFIVYQDSSYVEETIISDEPGLDDKIAAQRRDKYIVTEEQVIDTNPRQTLYEQKTKIDRTYNRAFNDNRSTDVIGVYKIMLVDTIIENLKEYFYSADEILKRYKSD